MWFLLKFCLSEKPFESNTKLVCSYKKLFPKIKETTEDYLIIVSRGKLCIKCKYFKPDVFIDYFSTIL